LIDIFEEYQNGDIDEEINMMEADLSKVYLTQDDYEKFVSFNSYFNEDNNNNKHPDSSSPQYRAFCDALQVELHRKYDLIPRTSVNTKTHNQGQLEKTQNKDKG